MKKIIFLVFALAIGPVACEICSDYPEYFDIEGVNISNAKFTGEGTNPWEIINNSNEPILWNNFFMRVGYDEAYYFAYNNSGFNLLADCLSKGYLGSEVGVDTLYLVSLFDYNDNYLALDTLNDMLLVNNWTYNADDYEEFFSLSDYIEQNRSNIPAPGVFELKLSEAPSSDVGQYQFKLIYILNDGEIHINQNNLVTIKK